MSFTGFKDYAQTIEEILRPTDLNYKIGVLASVMTRVSLENGLSESEFDEYLQKIRETYKVMSDAWKEST